MHEDDHNHEHDASDLALVTRDGDLPAGMDPVVAMDVVRRYVESERLRSRRVVVWASTIFLLVVLMVLTLFIAISIYVVRNSRETTQVVSTVRQQAHQAVSKVDGVVNRVSGLEDKSQEILGTVEQSETSRVIENRMFKTNLERFGKWVSANGARRARSIDALESQMKRLESLLESRQKEITELNRKYQAAVVQNEGGGAAASAVADQTGGGPDEDGVAGAAQAAGALSNVADAYDVSGVARTPVRLREISDPESARRELAGPTEDENDLGDVHVVRFPSGDRYEGQLRGGLLNGWGVYYFRNGDRYEGNFRDDMKQGYGVLYFRNGDIYKGEFRDDQRHGKGTYIFANGSRYIGEFREGKRHGRGRYIYEDGQEYIGEFRDGKAEGPGFSVMPPDQAAASPPITVLRRA